MDFASQAHRDKLKLAIKIHLFYCPLLVAQRGTATQTTPSPTTDPVASQVPENADGLEYREG